MDKYRTMNGIRSYHHDMYTEQVKKIALSSNDDKRVIQEHGIYTLAIGHGKLQNPYIKCWRSRITKRFSV